MLRFIGNVFWFILGGFISAMIYILGGVFLCLTVFGIPFGLQSFRIGFATFAPFGKEVVASRHAANPLGIVFDVIWLIFFGWVIALSHLALAVLLGISIIGIPFAIQHLKLIPVSLVPFGRELRPYEL